MKRQLGGAFEALHLLSTAIVFTAAFWLAPHAHVVRGLKVAGLAESTVKFGDAAQPFLLHRGPWFAALALIFAGVAGYLRNDLKKVVSMVRLAASGVALLASVWASLDLPAHRLPHAWDLLFFSCTVVLALTGFVVSLGKGGPSKAKEPSK